jgi:hypothetical protein
MELAGNIADLLRNDQDRSNYSTLIRLIRGKNCSVFVGAGLSVQAGYPSTYRLIEYLIAESGIDPQSIQSIDDISVKLQRIKELIEVSGQNIYEIMYRRFNEDHFQINGTIPLYEYLVRTPFKSFITTNFDSCIERAAELQNITLSEIQVFPDLNSTNLELKKLYHIHGKINLDDLVNSSRSLVLTSDDFTNAYGESSSLPVFIRSIFGAHNILFIGFGLEERTMSDLLELSRRQKEFTRGFGEKSIRNSSIKFAILPIELNKMDHKKRTDEEIRVYLDSISRKDHQLLDEFDVLVIRYYANEVYTEIKKIINDIYESTIISSIEVEPAFGKTGVPV